MRENGDQRSKAEVRHQLLTPLLSWAAHYAHIIDKPSTVGEGEGFEYSSQFSFEPSTENRPGRKGRKPQVDYAISGHIGDHPLYQMAAEAKVKLVPSDIAQLAQYMSTLVNGEHLRERSTVGILLDKDALHFAFSALCLPDEGKTPLPIVVISPSLKWRVGTAVQRGACISLCVLQNFTINRVVVDEVLWENAIGRLLWEEMKKIAVEIAKEGFVMESSATNVPYNVMQELVGLRSEVAVLRQLVIGQACAPPNYGSSPVRRYSSTPRPTPNFMYTQSRSGRNHSPPSSPASLPPSKRMETDQP